MSILEPARRIPLAGEADVLVAGGGIAGISAALAAAREGAKVCLLEREWLLGGLGTLGQIAIFLPLCDGNGRQVIAGIGEELLKMAIAGGKEASHLPNPHPWLNRGSREERSKIRFQAQYNPHFFALMAEKLLLREGVTVLYGTLAAQAVLENSRLTAVIAEDKSGRFAIRTKAAVDATGDADLCFFAGIPTVVHPDGNAPAAWYYADTGEGRRLRMLGLSESAGTPRIFCTETNPRQELGGGSQNMLAMMSHTMILEDIRLQQEGDPEYTIACLPVLPQVRMTRRLSGEFTMTVESCQVHQEQSIGMCGDWRKPGPVFEIPFGALYSEAASNLFAAGRCVSAEGEMWNITRVIPVCAVTGQAAGLAAAMCDKYGRADAGTIQQGLKRQGVLLHAKDLP